jgi:hypothetical protein
MDKIVIQKTKTSPEIIMDFDKGILDIVGESYPENAVMFYKPVFDWLSNAISSKKALKVNFKLDYFNTSSSKCVIDILDTLDKYFSESGQVEVKWFYREDDDDMLETGEEFSSDIKVPFELISYT